MATLRKIDWVTAITGVVAGFALGALCIHILDSSSKSSDTPPVRQSDFNPDASHPHIDPLLMSTDSDEASHFSTLKHNVENIIDSYTSKGVLKTSVYFRDFNTLRRFEVNRSERYSPASLMKVPMMMGYLKAADKDSTILKKRLTYTGTLDENAIESIPGSIQLQPHHSYTITELIEHMIRYSDNNAAQLLYEYSVNDKRIDLTGMLKDLGIKEADAGADYMTVHAYARYFRVLYNSTYLDRDYSEYALQELLRTEYTQGMRSVIPKSIDVAEKFGEYRMTDINTGVLVGRELHDCGIVYYPKHPYLLCVMTKGADLPTLQKMIAEINAKIYEFVDFK